jgi:putative peptidoglycan lipid II flippase
MVSSTAEKQAEGGRRSFLARLLHRQSVAQAAIFVSIVTVMIKAVGYARDALVAHHFGATGQTDAFLIGMMVPNVLLGLVATGLGTLIVPWYIDHRKQDPEQARTLVNQVTLVWGMAFLIVSAAVWTFAPQLVHLFAHNYAGAQYTLAVQVTRWLVPMGFFNVMTGLFIGLSQAEGQFLLPLVANLTGNTILLGCIYVFSSRLGIHSWTLGQSIMAVIAFAPVAWLLFRRYRFFRTLDLRHMDWQAIGRFALLLLPLVISGGGGSLNTMVDRWFAARLPAGGVSALDFANRVWTLPMTLIATPMATAVFPWFSSMAVDGTKLGAFDEKVRKTITFLAYLIIPCTIGLVVLAQPVVRMLFQRGAFDAAATRLTALCVQMYALGLISQASFPIFHRVFFSFKDTTTPLVVGVTMIAINAVTDYYFGKWLGASGIALSTTVAVTVGMLMDAFLVRRYFRGEVRTAPPYPIAREGAKILIACIPVLGVSLLGRSFIEAGSGFVGMVIRAVLVVGGAAVVYAGASILLRLDSWQVVMNRLRRRAGSARTS